MADVPSELRQVIHEASASELSGEVTLGRSGGVIRYRCWPARRHIWLTAAFLLGLAASTGFAIYAFDGVLWGLCVFLGLASTGALFFFPTEVNLDGPALNIRHLSSPRSYDLRCMGRLEVAGELFQRVELGLGRDVQAMDAVRGVTLPLPRRPADAARVLAHLRHFVAKPDEDSQIFGDESFLPLEE